MHFLIEAGALQRHGRRIKAAQNFVALFVLGIYGLMVCLQNELALVADLLQEPEATCKIKRAVPGIKCSSRCAP